jgi:DNA (cytosine-5)-methyltransferase 1
MTKTPQQIRNEVEKKKKTLKILNLYAGIGGNRKLWNGDIEVTAIENNPEIAKIYQDFFPNDRVIVTDAHQYLLEHYKEFDFIWSSPPCQSHGVSRFWGSKANYKKMKYPSPIYPDMSLYQEIIFLKHFFKGKWVVENVVGYYKPLIEPQQFRSHYYWSNFKIEGEKRDRRFISESKIGIFEKKFNMSLRDIKIKSVRKLQVIRNMVEPQTALRIFNMAFKEPQLTLGDLK